MQINTEILILGAGISGLAAGYKCEERNKEYLILEQNPFWGGLCANFTIDSFRFDRFVHLSFTENPIVKNIFDKVPHHSYKPNPENYYHGIWLKHPAQNNLFPLSDDVKREIISDMRNRRNSLEIETVENYEQWLRIQFGNYFAENFSMVYTKKYWGVDARELGTGWIGNRIYQPTLEEVEAGMNSSDTPITYYAKEMRYPAEGGFSSFLIPIVEESHIKLDEKVVWIDTDHSIVQTTENEYHYKHLVSSIPLPEYPQIMQMDRQVEQAVKNLSWTSAYLVSLGLKESALKKDNIWDYIYDSDIYPARIYLPGKKSKDNCPKDMESIQAEIYFKMNQCPDSSKEEILHDTIKQLDSCQIIDGDGVVVSDIRYEKYANVIFDHQIELNREKILKYLFRKNIIPIGRFGKWDYYWTDQSFMSGYTFDEGLNLK